MSTCIWQPKFWATPARRCDNMFAPKKGASFPTRFGVKLYIYCHWKPYNRRYGWCQKGPITSPGIITNWKIFGNEIGISLNMFSQTLSPTKSAQPVSLRKDCRLIRLTSLECPKVQDDVSFRMTPVIVSPPAAPCSASSWNKNETTDSPRGRWFSYAAGKLHVKALVDSAKPNFQIGIPKNISLWLQRATEKSVRFQTNLACIRII